MVLQKVQLGLATESRDKVASDPPTPSGLNSNTPKSMSILEYLGPIEKVSDYILDSSDEDEWDPYHCRGELSPGIPFLAWSDEDPDSEDVRGCGEDEAVETLAKGVRAANRLVEEMPYRPKYGFNYATNKSDCARESKAKEDGKPNSHCDIIRYSSARSINAC